MTEYTGGWFHGTLVRSGCITYLAELLNFVFILRVFLVTSLQVEDMLKRSFAEFHAQKKLPEQQQLLMRKLAQPIKIIE